MLVRALQGLPLLMDTDTEEAQQLAAQALACWRQLEGTAAEGMGDPELAEMLRSSGGLENLGGVGMGQRGAAGRTRSSGSSGQDEEQREQREEGRKR